MIIPQRADSARGNVVAAGTHLACSSSRALGAVGTHASAGKAMSIVGYVVAQCTDVAVSSCVSRIAGAAEISSKSKGAQRAVSTISTLEAFRINTQARSTRKQSCSRLIVSH